MHTVAFLNYVGEAKRLIDNGADVNEKDTTGATPLHVAAQTNATAVAKLLIEFGAKANDGITPTDLWINFWR